jgi:hypothetical protein
VVSCIAGTDHLADEAGAALAFVQLAVARAEVALDAAVGQACHQRAGWSASAELMAGLLPFFHAVAFQPDIVGPSSWPAIRPFA